MRLDRYLNEAIKPQLTKAVRITMKGWNNFLTELDHHWNKYHRLNMANLERMLSMAFFDQTIEFEQADESQRAEQEEGFSKNTFVLGGLHDLEGTIYLQLSKVTAKLLTGVLKRHNSVHDITDKTNLFNEIVNILAHELVHREQYKKAGMKIFPKEKKFHFKRYLKDTQELIAFGQQYANDVYLRRDSDLEEIYRETFGKTHKVYKKFMRVYADTLAKLKKGDTDQSLD